jgi:hemerythrin-like metal-binding protein
MAAARIVGAVEWGRRAEARELLAPGGAYAVQSVAIVAAAVRLGARVVDWDGRTCPGSKDLDADHRELAVLVESVEETVRGQAPPDELDTVLMRLMAGATDHFETEHDLMRSTGYERSCLEEHVQAHNYFLDQVLRLRRACSRECLGLLPGTIDVLRPWLVDHQRVLDATLCEHLAQAQLGNDRG